MPRSGPRLFAVIAIRMSFGRGLRVLDDDVEVAVVVEDAGVEQLVLEVLAAARAGSSATRSSYGNAACGYL